MKRTTTVGPWVRAYKCSTCGNVSYPYQMDWVRVFAISHEVCPICGIEESYIPIVGRVTTTTEKTMFFKQDVVNYTFTEK